MLFLSSEKSRILIESPSTKAARHSWPGGLLGYMSYSLNSLKGINKRILLGTIIGLIKGDTRSLDCNHYNPQYNPSFHFMFHLLFHLILHY